MPRLQEEFPTVGPGLHPSLQIVVNCRESERSALPPEAGPSFAFVPAGALTRACCGD
jgi:hypothetical protein